MRVKKVPGNRKRKRIFGAWILLLMAVLAAGTALAFAEEGGAGSYSFTIQKVFAAGTPEEVKNAAAHQTYTFRVEGTDGGEKFVETVTITGQGEAKVGGFSSPPQISVIEQTDDGHFQVGDEHWDVTGTYCESSIHVTQTTADVSISKDGGTIKVTREAGLPAATFRLTGELTHSGESYGPVPTLVPGDGSTVTLGSSLKAGTYHIEKLRAKEGFEVLVGEREFEVPANGTGEVHINGNDSKLLITAPGSVGEGRTHYYQISDVNHRDTREIVLQSGETGTVEHLGEGDYTIKVSKTYAGFKGYTLTVPQATGEDKGGNYSGIISTSATARLGYITVGGDYIGNLTYGPLYNNKGGILSSAKYKFCYGALKPDNPDKYTYWTTALVQGDKKDVKVSLTGDNKAIVREPLNGRLYIGTREVSDPNAYRVGVHWTEYTREENSYTVTSKRAGTWYREMVDDRGWLTISKEADSSARGGDVKYYYTIINSNGDPITYTKATDRDGNPVTVTTSSEGRVVMLKAGESVTFEGLKGNGYYRVKETVEAAEPMGFRVELEDTSKSTTFVGGSIDIEIKGQRTVDIKKFGDASSGDTREYTFDIFRDGEDTPVNGQPIHLKAGESTKVSEQMGFMLEPGKYTIKATNDAVRGFDVTYGDSSNITADKSVDAVVTFTNTFGKVDASYHVIHEYYLKNSDGTLSFQGASPVFTKNCGMVLPGENKFYTKDVHQLLMFEGNTYQHVDDGYGKVVSWEKGSEAKTVPLEEEDQPYIYDGSYQAKLTGSSENGEIEYAYQPLTNMEYAQAISHHETEDPAHILILRYVREKTEVEQGKYNIIHVYYKRTSQGDVWEGSSELEEVVFTPLTDDDRYTSHDADEVTKQRSFTPTKDNLEGRVYDYTYDGAVYGRLVDSSNTGEGTTGDGKEYQKDETMTSVRPTVEGDQIIVLRYFREGGYNVVHEYYYREKANTSEGSGDVEETPGEDAGDQTTPEEQGGAPQPLSLDGEDSFNGTLTDKDGYTYTFEGHSSISLHSDRLGTEHDGSSVDKEYSFRPVGDEEHEYRFIDAVYGYADHEAYTLAPYMTGVTANADYDEIIILRYFRDESAPEKPPVNPDKPPVNPDNPPENPDNPPENPDNPPENPDNPPENPDNPPKDPDNPPKDPDNPPKDPDNPPEDPENPPENPENPPEDPENPPENPENPPEDPENPPENPENPPEDPENPPENPENPPENPGYPTELPDPNDPDSPDTITIWEDGVPKAYMKVWDPENEAWIYIPEEDVPLWNSRVPKTGDESRIELWAALAAASLGGIVVLTLEPKKRKNK